MAIEEVTFYKRCVVCFQWQPCTAFDRVGEKKLAKMRANIAAKGRPWMHDEHAATCKRCARELREFGSSHGHRNNHVTSERRLDFLARLVQAERRADAVAVEREADAPAGEFQSSPLDYDAYSAYIDSVEWQNKKREVFAERPRRCERCGEKQDVEVHHATYQRLGHELLDDLIILCIPCHKREHGRASGDAAYTSFAVSRQWGYRQSEADAVKRQPQRILKTQP